MIRTGAQRRWTWWSRRRALLSVVGVIKIGRARRLLRLSGTGTGTIRARDVCCAPVSWSLLLVDVVDCCLSSDREREGRSLFVVLPVGTYQQWWNAQACIVTSLLPLSCLFFLPASSISSRPFISCVCFVISLLFGSAFFFQAFACLLLFPFASLTHFQGIVCCYK